MSAYCHASNPSATAGCARVAGHEGEHQAVSGETWEPGPYTEETE